MIFLFNVCEPEFSTFNCLCSLFVNLPARNDMEKSLNQQLLLLIMVGPYRQRFNHSTKHPPTWWFAKSTVFTKLVVSQNHLATTEIGILRV